MFEIRPLCLTFLKPLILHQSTFVYRTMCVQGITEDQVGECNMHLFNDQQTRDQFFLRGERGGFSVEMNESKLHRANISYCLYCGYIAFSSLKSIL